MCADQERFGREQKIRRQRWQDLEPDGPHGGWIEMFAKAVFVVLAILLAGEGIYRFDLMKDRPLRLSEEERAALLDRATRIHDRFMVRRADWANQEAADARSGLLEIRDRFNRFDGAERRWHSQIQEFLDQVVRGALDERYMAAERARSVEERGRAMAARHQLQRLFDHQSVDGFELMPVDQAGNQMWLPKATPEERSYALGITVFLLRLYLFFIPFALLCFIVRAHRLGYSVAEEVVLGWKNLCVSAVFWPLGLGSYPRSTARELRRAAIQAEYLARTGKRSTAQFTVADRRQVEELVELPFAALRAQLEAVTTVSARMLWQARLAVYATMIAAALAGPFRRHALANEAGAGAKQADETVEVMAPAPPAIHGLLQLLGGGPGVPLDLARAWLFVDADPHRLVHVHLRPDLRTATLLDAWARVELPAGFSIRGGQLTGRGADSVPRPDKERIIGGPGASALVTFYDIVGELAFRRGQFEGAVQVLSGSGKNTPDETPAKDVLGSAAYGPWGPMRFQLVFQGGEQPDGFRTRALASAIGNFGPVTVGFLATHERSGERNLWAGSGMIAWRVHELVDVAAGYDELQLAENPPDHIGRAQVTLLPFGNTLELELAYRYAAAADAHQGLGRLQASF